MTKLLLYKPEIVAAGLVKLACVCMPEAVDGIMSGQTRSGSCSFEGFFNGS